MIETVEDAILALEARVRPRAVRAVAERALAELGVGPVPRSALLSALVRCADVSIASISRVRANEAAVGVAYQAAATPEAKREVLSAQLERWAAERVVEGRFAFVHQIQNQLRLAGDKRALERNLDIEAVSERFAEAIANLLDEVEVAYHATATLARALDDSREAVRAATDGGVLRLAMEHADPGQSPTIRRAALLAAVALVERIPVRERLGHLGPQAARSVITWARGISAGRWIQIAAMELAVLIFPDEALPLLVERLKSRGPEDEDGLIIRRNALRILGTLPPPSARRALGPSLRSASSAARLRSGRQKSGEHPTLTRSTPPSPSTPPPTTSPPSVLPVTPAPSTLLVPAPPTELTSPASGSGTPATPAGAPSSASPLPATPLSATPSITVSSRVVVTEVADAAELSPTAPPDPPLAVRAAADDTTESDPVPVVSPPVRSTTRKKKSRKKGHAEEPHPAVEAPDVSARGLVVDGVLLPPPATVVSSPSVTSGEVVSRASSGEEVVSSAPEVIGSSASSGEVVSSAPAVTSPSASAGVTSNPPEATAADLSSAASEDDREDASDGASEDAAQEEPTTVPPEHSGIMSLPPGVTVAPPPDPVEVAWIAHDDPSEHVRQELARQLAAFGRDDAFDRLISLALDDKSPRVRGLALRVLARAAMRSPSALPHAERGIRRSLGQVGPPVAARTSFEAIRLLCTGPFGQLPPTTFVKDLTDFANRPETKPELADEAAGLLRLLEVEQRPVADRIRHTLIAALDTLFEGERCSIELPTDAEPRDIERALAVASRGDLTATLRHTGPGRYVLTRGEPRGFRFWRAIHEMRTPAPDKRKGWVHTAGRVFVGEISAPSVGMCEVTPTRIPGERHLHPEVGGWGAFLPRIDDLLAVSGRNRREIRIITAGGTVTLGGPETLRQRLKAWWRLSLHYERWAQTRSRSIMATEPAEQRRYATLISEMGFTVTYGDTSGDVRGVPYRIEPLLPVKYLGTEVLVQEIGGSALSAPILPVWIESFVSYLVSPSGNTPVHLAWVVWVILAFLVLRNAWVMGVIERARYGIPISVGGWGTRGKSGSERLKAALFHALRFDVVVKTTGCEAMFIHAMRDLPAGEIFIYRPYDKATIWEQRNILVAARNLRCQVFLWECMALQPLFVDTLCSEWMQDEITTLTNAYPDHEDIQGPGGEDVARVIARFMPTEGLSLTTEEQMLPLLKDAAKTRNTNLISIPPVESDLIPVDLLDRLPYQEHPRNISLILTLAEHFGIDYEWALVEIADHVILDLGVLKTYPTVSYRGRKLTFSNGMSANERAGFMSNWIRLAYDKHDPDEPPGRATVMVVNNRADRVARSRVFAQIIVEDIGIDHVILINTNLGGMMQFITEGLDLKLKDMLVTGDGGKERALQRFDQNMKKVGIPARPGALEDDLTRMLTAFPMDEAKAKEMVASVIGKRESPDAVEAALKALLDPLTVPEGEDDIRPDILLHAARRVRRLNARDKARVEVSAALDRNDEAGANQIFRTVYRELFLERVEVLWNADAKGDKVVDFMTRAIPPGMDARIMGSQNIKGTGLDFVYRWLSMDRVRLALEKMQKNPSSRRELVNWMLSYTDFGLIDVREALAYMRGVLVGNDEAWAEHKSLVESAIKRLETLDRDKTAGLDAVAKAGMMKKVLGRLEQGVDHLDSVRRTYRARRVMNDLFAQRVGHSGAALLLREIVGRGKGGWLYKDVTEMQEKWGGRFRAWKAKRKAPKPDAET
ncbi:capsule biosynthesis protein CapB [Chondromyces crocatus]|uniref:Capsule biosynthesis protein CapB n=2 Tax=Chondromyces crocatus TaxID=52 RepID=A0A0K1E8D2_CHOCO|nr:capsule biosynthesis protein CapB [Chondromyces crocatus]